MSPFAVLSGKLRRKKNIEIQHLMTRTVRLSTRPSAIVSIRAPLVSLVLACLTLAVGAAESKPADATGTWKWTMTPPNGQPFEMSLKLKQDGEKLTGLQLGRGGEVAIQDGQAKEGNLSFKVVRDRGGDVMTFKYQGTLKGDTIEGKIESNVGGESRTRDWIAKRQAPQTIHVTGTWQWTFSTPGGQNFEPRARLSQSGDKLTGAIIWGETETSISDGRIEDRQISFKVVRTRDGRKVTTQYKGQLTGESIRGKIESDWSGDVQTFEWTARKSGG